MSKATIVFCDNVSACYMSSNPVHHKRTKHIELDVHFVREKVAVGQCQIIQVPTTQQLADVMTKGLPTASFKEFRDSLCVAGNDAHTAGGVSEHKHVPWLSLFVAILVSPMTVSMLYMYKGISLRSIQASCSSHYVVRLHGISRSSILNFRCPRSTTRCRHELLFVLLLGLRQQLRR